MDQWVRRLLLTCVVPLGLLLGAGCPASTVGDPCEPETIPPGGFDDKESYLETSSVQCRTRVCLVYRLKGDPTNNCRDQETPDCTLPEDVANRIYCTCRCGAPAGTDSPTCECPDGFSCEEILTNANAGTGTQGSYCVRKGT